MTSRAPGADPGVKLGESQGAPEAKPDGTAIRGAARGFADTKQGVSHKQRIAPRHRGVVRRYFNGQKKESGKK